MWTPGGLVTPKANRNIALAPTRGIWTTFLRHYNKQKETASNDEYTTCTRTMIHKYT